MSDVGSFVLAVIIIFCTYEIVSLLERIATTLEKLAGRADDKP